MQLNSPIVFTDIASVLETTGLTKNETNEKLAQLNEYKNLAGPNKLTIMTNEDKYILLCSDVHRLSEKYDCETKQPNDTLLFHQFLEKLFSENKDIIFDVFTEDALFESKDKIFHHLGNSQLFTDFFKQFGECIISRSIKEKCIEHYPTVRFHMSDVRRYSKFLFENKEETEFKKVKDFDPIEKFSLLQQSSRFIEFIYDKAKEEKQLYDKNPQMITYYTENNIPEPLGYYDHAAQQSALKLHLVDHDLLNEGNPNYDYIEYLSKYYEILNGDIKKTKSEYPVFLAKMLEFKILPENVPYNLQQLSNVQKHFLKLRMLSSKYNRYVQAFNFHGKIINDFFSDDSRFKVDEFFNYMMQSKLFKSITPDMKEKLRNFIKNQKDYITHYIDISKLNKIRNHHNDEYINHENPEEISFDSYLPLSWQSDLLVIIMDMYLLSRLFKTFKFRGRETEIHQDTVKNAIIMAGGRHIQHYIEFLKELGFDTVYENGYSVSDTYECDDQSSKCYCLSLPDNFEEEYVTNLLKRPTTKELILRNKVNKIKKLINSLKNRLNI